MDTFSGLAGGFAEVFQLSNLLVVVVGVLIGMVVGVLPGLGPTATIAILLPLTYNLDPTASVIMLAGIYYGSMYGGTLTSVMLNLPGEAASVVTAIDGHQMAKQGRAGAALGIAAIGSFVGGIAATVALVVVAGPLASIAAGFGAPEFTAVGVLGLVLVTVMASRSLPKAVIMAALGLLLAAVGQDPVTGNGRFTFGSTDLLAGLDFVALAMGIFGLGEVFYNLRYPPNAAGETMELTSVYPTRQDLVDSRGSIARGTVIGSLLGLIPGAGGTLSSMMSYAAEKKLARDPSRFGQGAIEGVAGPETANNAGATSSFVPLLTIGLPSNSVMALMFGALLIQGISPGPGLVDDHPEVFWGVLASMFVGNVVLLAMNLPLVGVFVRLLHVRMGVLGAITVLVTMIGVYSVNNRAFDLIFVLLAGVLGYFMRKFGFEGGPLVLAFILGGVIDAAFRRSLLMSNGDLGIFAERPISATVLLLAAGLFVAQVVSYFRGRGMVVAREE